MDCYKIFLTIIHISILLTWLVPKKFAIDVASARLTNRLLKYSLFNPLQAFRAGEEFRQELEKNYYKDLFNWSLTISLSAFLFCVVVYVILNKEVVKQWLMF